MTSRNCSSEAEFEEIIEGSADDDKLVPFHEKLDEIKKDKERIIREGFNKLSTVN